MTDVYAIVNTLAEIGFVRKSEERRELIAMNISQLIKEYILPRCLCLPRSGERYPRISGRFMKLMAKHGKDFLEEDYELGSILLELAMQRITKHPELPAMDYLGILPDAYKPYSAASVNFDGYNGCPDEPGLWGDAEVAFLMEQLPTCLALRDMPFALHAQTILWQLLTKLNGRDALSSSMLSMNCKRTEDELWLAAVDITTKANLTQDMIDRCVSAGWRCGKRFFVTLRNAQLNYLLGKIDFDKEVYYTGFKRFLLKGIVEYNRRTEAKIREEICSEK